MNSPSKNLLHFANIFALPSAASLSPLYSKQRASSQSKSSLQMAHFSTYKKALCFQAESFRRSLIQFGCKAIRPQIYFLDFLPLSFSRSTSSTVLSEGLTRKSTTMTIASTAEMENRMTETVLFCSH